MGESFSMEERSSVYIGGDVWIQIINRPVDFLIFIAHEEGLLLQDVH